MGQLNFKADLKPTSDNLYSLGDSGKGWKIQRILVPTASNGTTFGPGTNGQVLKTNGTTIYWGDDANASLDSTKILVCTTVSGTAAKTATGFTGFTLDSGSSIYIKFNHTNSQANPTLNISSTGAKSIYYRGSQVKSYGLQNDVIYHMIYDGTYWQIVNDIEPTIGTCTTGAGTAAKVVNCPGFVLYSGAIAKIKFTNTNTANAPTLNINGTGAIAVKWMGATNGLAYKLRNDHLYYVMYDGTNYVILDDTFQHYNSMGSAATTYTQADYDEYVAANGTAPSWSVGDQKAAAVEGLETLAIGNNVSSTANGGMTGQILLYGTSSNYHILRSAKTSSTARTMYLPDYAGDGYLTHVSGTGTTGSATLPTYVAANGRITACSGTLGVNISGSAGTATKLAAKKTIDGVSFDGSADIIHYGVCSTGAGSAAKTVSITGFTLASGAVAYVKFTNTNTAATPTLNINSTGAKNIFDNRGTQIATVSSYPTYLQSGIIYCFVYDGTQYNIINAPKTLELYEKRNSTTDLNKPAIYGGAGAMYHLIASSSTTSGKCSFDANVLQMNWDNNGGYDAQLAISTSNSRMQFRSRASQGDAWREAVTISKDTAAGSATMPIYVDASGKALACSGTIAVNISGNATTATKLGSSNVGDTTTPIYLDSGTPKITAKYASGTSVTLNGTNKAASTISIYAPTEGGTADTQALVAKGNNTAPAWVNISPGITITAGTSSAAPQVNVSVLGRSGTAQAITTATSGVYGVTKLTTTYSSGDASLATTGKAVLEAIQTLDVSDSADSTKYVSQVSETDGKISVSRASFSPSITIGAGTSSATPTINVTVAGNNGTAQSFTKASTSVYGATKLSSTASTTEETLAATPKGVQAAINTLSAASVGGASGIICSISQSSGKITATASTLTAGSQYKGIYISGGTIKPMTYELLTNVLDPVEGNCLAIYTGGGDVGENTYLKTNIAKTYANRTIASGDAGIIASKKIFATAFETSGYFLMNTNNADSTTGYLLYGNNTPGGRFIIDNVGTKTTEGTTKVIVGNAIATGTAGNARGYLYLYGSGTNYARISSSNNTTGDTNHYLTDTTGWIVGAGNGTTTGAGSSKKPVYVNNSGIATAIDTEINSGTANTLAYYDTATSISSNSYLQTLVEKTYASRTIESGNAGIISSKRIFASAFETENWFLANTDTAGTSKGFLLFGNDTPYGRFYVNIIGTTSAQGYATLQLGNDIACGTVNCARGLIRLYGQGDNGVTLEPYTTTHLINNAYSAGGLDVGYMANGSLYRIWFGIGSGNQNRGIYQVAYGSGTSGWLMYWDSGRLFRYWTDTGTRYLRSSVNSGTAKYLSYYYDSGTISPSSLIVDTEYNYFGRTIASGNMGLRSTKRIVANAFETVNYYLVNSDAGSSNHGFIIQHSGQTVFNAYHSVAASSGGWVTMSVGNAIASGTAKNAAGEILLYGRNTGRVGLYAPPTTTSNRSATFPDVTGTILVGAVQTSQPSSPGTNMVWLRPI